MPLISIVVPIYCERENIVLLYEEIVEALAEFSQWEAVFVDDGSDDGSVAELKKIADDPRVRLVLLRRNYGQTAAMHAGIQNARGEYVVTLDGDLQNDPHDIPMMLEKLDEGFDLVHGWRRNRQDHWLSRKLPSKIANWLISRITGVPINDLGCTLKAMRAEIAKELELYGEMHRFIPIMADSLGARAVEVETRHRRRMHGQTKYGIGRTFRVILDLLTVRYMQKYFASPMRFFGTIGLCVGGIAFASLLTTLAMKLFGGTDMTGNPMFLLSILSAVISIQFFSMGMIGEVSARIYFGQSSERKNYRVREFVNFTEHDKRPQYPRRAA